MTSPLHIFPPSLSYEEGKREDCLKSGIISVPTALFRSCSQTVQTWTELELDGYILTGNIYQLLVISVPDPNQPQHGSLPVSHRYWSSITPILVQYHADTGPVSHRYWSSITPILVQYHTDTGPVSRRYWSSITPILEAICARAAWFGSGTETTYKHGTDGLGRRLQDMLMGCYKKSKPLQLTTIRKGSGGK